MELFTKTNRSFSTNSSAPRYSFRLDASRRPAATQSLVVKLCGIWADLPPLTRRIPHAGRRQIRSIYFWAGRQFWVRHVCLVWRQRNKFFFFRLEWHRKSPPIRTWQCVWVFEMRGFVGNSVCCRHNAPEKCTKFIAKKGRFVFLKCSISVRSRLEVSLSLLFYQSVARFCSESIGFVGDLHSNRCFPLHPPDVVCWKHSIRDVICHVTQWHVATFWTSIDALQLRPVSFRFVHILFLFVCFYFYPRQFGRRDVIESSERAAGFS